MVTLSVGRLHARYHLDRPELADALDECLRRVVRTELATALPGMLPDDRAEHVCIARLAVPVRLDPASGVVAAARTWAGAIAAAVRQAIVAGTGVVVYPRTLDALIDLVVALGRGDRSREWAWVQAGLLAGPGRAADPAAATAEALLARPELAPAALTAAAGRGPLAMGPTGWVAVAEAVRRLAWGSTDPASRVRPDEVLSQPPGVVGRPGGSGADPVASVRRVLAAPLTRQLIGVAAAAQRPVLARLAVTCAAPHLARRESVVAAVAAALGGSATTSPRLDRDGSGALAPDASASGRPIPAGPDPTPAGPDPSPAGRESGPETTEFGGVLFLIRVIEQLDLVTRTAAPGSPLADRPFPWIVTELAGRLTGAAPQDPAVRALAGPPEPGPPAGAHEDAALTLLVEQIERYLHGALRRTPQPVPGRADELTWLWRRPAAIVAEPGWIEAEFSLADVDTAVRLAGLDLDPGFVWWIGAVVRFRYV